jgi:hypothetical protein
VTPPKPGKRELTKEELEKQRIEEELEKQKTRR